MMGDFIKGIDLIQYQLVLGWASFGVGIVVGFWLGKLSLIR